MRSYLVSLFLIIYPIAVNCQNGILRSPNNKIEVCLQGANNDPWSLSVSYLDDDKKVEIIPSILLGLSLEHQSFYSNLTLSGKSKVTRITERYSAIHGKSSERMNQANEISVSFSTPEKNKMDIVLRAYDDGICFRYEFPIKRKGLFRMMEEFTSYHIPSTSKRWLQQFISSYEGFYPLQNESIEQGEWGYPGLFKTSDNYWCLLTEANIDRTYCATKLSNKESSSYYRLVYPASSDGNNVGEVNPLISMPWKSPWRVAIIGSLSDIVESTLVEDVSEPCRIETDWIKPGISSWVYWAYNHGTTDYKKVCEYIDLAAEMGWPYTLFDWEWDQMANGGNLEDAVRYAKTKGIKPLIWYNSGGLHNKVSSTPRDRLLTPELRNKEFAKLKEMGFSGVKVDFFESDKQDMMNYYIDLIEDAAKYKLLINLHGSTVPRGWSRTYPNLISMEAVYGAEQYNNDSKMTWVAAELNTILPFTRNVIGPMDYTPVTFTNSQNPHATSFAHELALSVIFESAIQHLADRPQGFYNLPDAPKEFLRHVPTAWDETKLIDGYPGKKVLLARRRGNDWYIGGINGENREKALTLKFNFLLENKVYRATLIKDREYDTSFDVKYLSIKKEDEIVIRTLCRGGFVIHLELI